MRGILLNNIGVKLLNFFSEYNNIVEIHKCQNI